MNRPFVLLVVLVLVLDSPSWFRGRERGRARLGSWPQCMRKNERGLPMNRPQNTKSIYMAAALTEVRGAPARKVDSFFFLSSSAACAAAKRATGTRNGEQLT